MKTNWISGILFICLLSLACKKETTYIYELDPVQVKKDQSQKQTPKSTTEFISIAYSDVTGKTISQNTLSQLSLLYVAFGDKKLLEDMLVRNFLKMPEALERIETNEQMREDIPAFVKAMYAKLYNREPNELELWTVSQKIQKNAELSPVMVYYSMMTSDEYRFY